MSDEIKKEETELDISVRRVSMLVGFSVFLCVALFMTVMLFGGK